MSLTAHNFDSPENIKIPNVAGHRKRLKTRFFESLLATGESALPDLELLELLLFLSHPRGDVKPKAKALLKEFKSFRGVIQAPIEKLEKIDGIGESTITILKIIQAGNTRLAWQEMAKRPVFEHWKNVVDYCATTMGHLDIEQFRVLFLNTQNVLISDETQQTGTINQTAVFPREVIKRALDLNAANIILAHNHPSGNVTPSQADFDITRQIQAAARTMDIMVLDHIVIGSSDYYSFKEHNKL